MDEPICIAGALTLLLNWVGRARITDTAQPRTSRHVFPHSVDVIPGKLKVKIFLHDVKFDETAIPCWSYVTYGLAVATSERDHVHAAPGNGPETPMTIPAISSSSLPRFSILPNEGSS
jgi:hypothetical protein